MGAWSLSYDGFEPENEKLREALCTLGNGYVCTRGAAEEATADDVHYPGTYFAGGYNRMKTEIDGHILESEDLVNMPNWLPLTFRIEEGAWFRIREVDLLTYRQELDLKHGVLKRDIRFEDGEGRRTRVAFRRLVHMSRPHLAAQELRLTAENWSGRIEFRSALDGRVTNGGVARYRRLNGRHLVSLASEPVADDGICLKVRTHQSRLRVAMAARTRIRENGRDLTARRRIMAEKGHVAQLIGVEVEKDTPLVVEKVVGLFTSRDPAVSEAGLEACNAVRKAEGFEELLRSHALTWDHLWRCFDVMAVWVLDRALEILQVLPEDIHHQIREKLDLGDKELDRWRDITRRMRIPFHADGIISQFEGYERLEEFDWEGYREKYGDIQRLDRILEAEGDTPNRYRLSKQADVLMLFYLFSAEELKEIFEGLGYTLARETIPKNIDYYIRRTAHGSTLSRVVHSWVLARQDRERSWKLFNEALFSDLTDIQGGTTPEGIHLGAMAGTVDQVQRCFTGIVTRNDVLWLNPALPAELSKLRLQLRYRGYFLRIDVCCDHVTVTSLRNKEYPIRLGCGEKVVEVNGRQTVEFALG